MKPQKYTLLFDFLGGWSVLVGQQSTNRMIGSYTTLTEALDAIREYDKEAE